MILQLPYFELLNPVPYTKIPLFIQKCALQDEC